MGFTIYPFLCCFLQYFVISFGSFIYQDYLCGEMRDVRPYRVEPEKVKKRVRLVAVTTNPMDVVNVATGEVSRATPYVGNRAWRDISSFVKIFDFKKLIVLKPYEARVFFYLLDNLDFSGKVYYDEKACMEMTGLKRRCIFYGLRGLADKDYVRRDGLGCYWINPNIAFRGSRDDLIGYSIPNEAGDSF